ncbi:MAG TPA: hypothetical protein VLF69_05090 [Candidatus Saccharimonadales bacterium]|nr:hypothetical protein [Candidatus Saccharimonadales bacterium]
MLQLDANRMFVFDLDGVVTNPTNHAVSTVVLNHIADDLKAGKPVAFNTGRAYPWVEEYVLRNLVPMVSTTDLANLVIVTEMGAVVCTFHDGKPQFVVDTTIALPKSFHDDVETLLDKKLPDGSCYRDYAWWDQDRQAMGSFIKLQDVALKDFDRIRPLFTAEVEKLLHVHGLDEFVTGQTAIAVDVQHRSAGKAKGAGRIIEWMQQRGHNPATVYAFGDSISDKAMAEAFTQAGINATFIFVGDPTQQHNTIVTGGNNDVDTAAFLTLRNWK